ncbi:uncharacterized protein LOC115888972 [Sitophilus oryzae]|uniref:Uncharacterized protein LOC115888972 n=1 Tax=Sitophilus oryzae TaxID=7048 RepID=A0A6J2YPM1_SITOR|nr:uncharacterized protein LOC115888972 [Sitophilus oryzae]
MVFLKNGILVLAIVGCVMKVVLAGTTDPQRQKIIDFHAECLDAHGLDEEAMIEALDGNPSEDDSFYHHLFCAAKKANVMTENGEVTLDTFHIDMAGVIDSHNMENIHNILRKCLVQKADIMTTLRDAVQCFIKEDHNL